MVITIMDRLYNLDYLRGFAAFGIMILHYLSWTYGKLSADSFWGRVGIYGVSVFYVLSGLTLFYVYHKKMIPTGRDILSFFKKRFFRIFPLLWLATLASIVLSKQVPDTSQLILNLTGLFGFFDWDASFAIGAWSIGNELVFYIFFPIFILFLNKSKIALVALTILGAAVYFYFAFAILNTEQTLEDQWRNYVNPLNQVFLFLGGFLIGVWFQKIKLSVSLDLFLLIIGFAIFVFFPVSGKDRIYLVTGIGRLVFTMSCFLICLGFYKMRIEFPPVIHKPLSLLGEASYSVYLLHPLVFAILGGFFNLLTKNELSFSAPFKIIVSVVITLVSSYFVYKYFEKYFMRLSHQRKERAPGSILEKPGQM